MLQSVQPGTCLLRSVHQATCMLQSVQPGTCMLQSVYPATCLLQSVQPATCMLQLAQPATFMLQSVPPSACILQSIQPASCMLKSFQPVCICCPPSSQPLVCCSTIVDRDIWGKSPSKRGHKAADEDTHLSTCPLNISYCGVWIHEISLYITLFTYRSHCCMSEMEKHKIFPSSCKICAKFYAVLLQKWVMSHFALFELILMAFNLVFFFTFALLLLCGLYRCVGVFFLLKLVDKYILRCFVANSLMSQFTHFLGKIDLANTLFVYNKKNSMSAVSCIMFKKFILLCIIECLLNISDYSVLQCGQKTCKYFVFRGCSSIT